MGASPRYLREAFVGVIKAAELHGLGELSWVMNPYSCKGWFSGYQVLQLRERTRYALMIRLIKKMPCYRLQ